MVDKIETHRCGVLGDAVLFGARRAAKKSEEEFWAREERGIAIFAEECDPVCIDGGCGTIELVRSSGPKVVIRRTWCRNTKRAGTRSTRIAPFGGVAIDRIGARSFSAYWKERREKKS